MTYIILTHQHNKDKPNYIMTKRVMSTVFLLINILLFNISLSSATEFLIEAESFTNRGGWVIDNQSMEQMGSPYLLAHGIGMPVLNATTEVLVPETAKYRVWVRTRNWVLQWNVSGTPGKFKMLINGQPLDTQFGTEKANWHWQDGGVVNIKAGKNLLSLQDLTGFDGRCDAIILTTDMQFFPPNEDPELANLRQNLLGLSFEPEDAGTYDLVVVGGGMAGCCAALSAARFGCRVALIQNRPVLGGNNSSEVRVGLSGLIAQEPYPNLGKLVDEIGPIGYWNLWEANKDPEQHRSKYILEMIKKNPEKKIHNAGPASNYEDEKKLNVLMKENNIRLFLNTQVVKADKNENKISVVIGKNIINGRTLKFHGMLFADCTGDGNLGFLAGAHYRVGRESKAETGEPRAPEKADNLVMGTSVQWYAEEDTVPSLFSDCEWAVHFDEQTCQQITKGDWNWETGMLKDQIADIEYIRDYGLRAAYGNWSFLKNKSLKKNKYAKYKLSWVAYIGGKRESRRLMGDFILKEQDILNQTYYEDACFTTTWGVDLHYPLEIKGMNEPSFLSKADIREIKPYAVPYRCLYSTNIDNLFMAGRNISVTHVALGTIRVMRTGGIMGEVVGMAASLCKKFNTTPRGIYKNYLDELKQLMTIGVESKELKYGTEN